MRGCHDGMNPVSEGHLAHLEGFLPFPRSVIQIRKYVAVEVDHLGERERVKGQGEKIWSGEQGARSKGGKGRMGLPISWNFLGCRSL